VVKKRVVRKRYSNKMTAEGSLIYLQQNRHSPPLVAHNLPTQRSLRWTEARH
jgi:hypothetical protein